MKHTVRYSEEAALKRDSLDPARRKAFDRAIEVISKRPEHEKAIDMGENVRHIRLTQDILAEYVIFPQFVMVLVLNVFDRQDAITDEESE